MVVELNGGWMMVGCWLGGCDGGDWRRVTSKRQFQQYLPNTQCVDEIKTFKYDAP